MSDTSERLYGISCQPSDTCPIINEIISRANSIQSTLKEIERCDDLEYLPKMVRDIEWDMGKLESAAEEVRQANCDLRSWGQEWKDLAKAKIDEVGELETELEVAQEKVKQLTPDWTEPVV